MRSLCFSDGRLTGYAYMDDMDFWRIYKAIIGELPWSKRQSIKEEAPS